MEDTENVDPSRVLNHVGDLVVTMKKDTDVPVRSLPIPEALFGELSKDLCFLVERFNGAGCSAARALASRSASWRVSAD